MYHPNQTLTDKPNGALTVRFSALGQLEMAWHLYAWGDAVEVMGRASLYILVQNHSHDDFIYLP